MNLTESDIKLANKLRAYALDIEKGWLNSTEVLGNLLIICETGGYIRKIEEHYVKRI